MAHRVILESFSYQYPGQVTPALADISLAVPKGQCCALLGPTSAGKTTLLQSISGILHKHHASGFASGKIVIGDESYAPLPEEIQFPKIAYALQDPYVQISGVRETVLDEIRFTLENLGRWDSSTDDSILSLLRHLGIDHLAERKPTTLSGGETQRVALATILIAEPDVLLLDEPLTALDYVAQDRLSDLFKGIKERSTILFTDTHMEFALAVADVIVVLEKGRMVFSGDRKGLLDHIDSFESILPSHQWKELIRTVKVSQGPEATEAILKAMETI
ncbi:MAG TPA: hypothetical protein DCP63_07035 [Bacteroidetes bacterium]|nr:hypothetical protein [Bacteroidota bacterium]